MQEMKSDCTFQASRFRKDELSNLVEVLKEMGLDVGCTFSDSGRTATITFENLPDPYEAHVKRTRRAGRTNKRFRIPNDSLFNPETPISEFLNWASDHTAEEAMSQLGLESRTTYYRKLKKMRETLERHQRWNAKNPDLNPLEATLNQFMG